MSWPFKSLPINEVYSLYKQYQPNLCLSTGSEQAGRSSEVIVRASPLTTLAGLTKNGTLSQSLEELWHLEQSMCPTPDVGATETVDTSKQKEETVVKGDTDTASDETPSAASMKDSSTQKDATPEPSISDDPTTNMIDKLASLNVDTEEQHQQSKSSQNSADVTLPQTSDCDHVDFTKNEPLPTSKEMAQTSPHTQPHSAEETTESSFSNEVPPTTPVTVDALLDSPPSLADIVKGVSTQSQGSNSLREVPQKTTTTLPESPPSLVTIAKGVSKQSQESEPWDEVPLSSSKATTTLLDGPPSLADIVKGVSGQLQSDSLDEMPPTNPEATTTLLKGPPSLVTIAEGVSQQLQGFDPSVGMPPATSKDTTTAEGPPTLVDIVKAASKQPFDELPIIAPKVTTSLPELPLPMEATRKSPPSVDGKSSKGSQACAYLDLETLTKQTPKVKGRVIATPLTGEDYLHSEFLTTASIAREDKTFEDVQQDPQKEAHSTAEVSAEQSTMTSGETEDQTRDNSFTQFPVTPPRVPFLEQQSPPPSYQEATSSPVPNKDKSSDPIPIVGREGVTRLGSPIPKAGNTPHPLVHEPRELKSIAEEGSREVYTTPPLSPKSCVRPKAPIKPKEFFMEAEPDQPKKEVKTKSFPPLSPNTKITIEPQEGMVGPPQVDLLSLKPKHHPTTLSEVVETGDRSTEPDTLELKSLSQYTKEDKQSSSTVTEDTGEDETSKKKPNIFQAMFGVFGKK